jgi:hypothetical protein
VARGAIHRPPYSGARGLLDWALDVWPYVNGKALTCGLNLREMDASPMLDVIHYFLEEDLLNQPFDGSEAKSKMRESLYRSMYERDYRYKVSSDNQGYNYSTASGVPSDAYAGTDVENPLDLPKKQTKPYVPPTNFDEDSLLPFGKLLDPPELH